MCGDRIPAFIWLPKILGCPKSKPIGSMYGIYANIGYIDGKCHHIQHTWILWESALSTKPE